MKKTTYLFCLCLLLSIATNAQSKEKSSLLWEISGNGLKQPSYLFGTVHMICTTDFFLPQLVKDKFIQANQVFLEFDMDDPALMVNMMKLAQLPNGQTMKQLFGDTAFQRFDSSFKQITGMSAIMFNQFKPLMMMSLLSEKTLSCESTNSYEQTFMTLAQQNKKDIKGLETMEDQMAVFDGIPDSVEIRQLKEMVYRFPQQVKDFEELVRIYKTQDIEQLFNLTQKEPMDAKTEEAMLTKRNNNWIPVMKTNMETGSCFFAVGAAHLGGGIGVIALLRQQGYTVKPVQLQ